MLSSEERSFVFKTSVDYTLCTKQGQPLVSVEFDGMWWLQQERGVHPSPALLETLES